MSDSASDPTGNLWKNEGNDHLQANRTQKAIECYNKAIECDPSNHIFFSNRAAAFLKVFEYENALADSNECIRISPEFAKAYTRKASALLNLGKFEECYEACIQGLKYETSSRILTETIKSCKRAFVAAQLRGKWIGQIPLAMGGYDQLFDFIDDEKVNITAMGQKIETTYTLNVDRTPHWMDVMMPAPPEMEAMRGPLPPSELPHIFRFDVDPLTAFVTKMEALKLKGLSKTQQKKAGKASLNQSTEAPTEDASADSAAPVEIPTVSSFDMAAPMMSPTRPTGFSPEATCTFRRINEAEDQERLQLINNERVVPAHIAVLSEDDQVSHFIEAMIDFIPKDPMERPEEQDGPEVHARKMGRIVQYQAEITKVDNQYPQEVSELVQKYTYAPAEEVPERFRERIVVLRDALQHHQGADMVNQNQQMEGALMEALEYAKEQAEAIRASGREPTEREIRALVEARLAGMNMPGSSGSVPAPAGGSNSAKEEFKKKKAERAAAAPKKEKESILEATTSGASSGAAKKDLGEVSLEDSPSASSPSKKEKKTSFEADNNKGKNNTLLIGAAVGFAAVVVGALLFLRKRN